MTTGAGAMGRYVSSKKEKERRDAETQRRKKTKREKNASLFSLSPFCVSALKIGVTSAPRIEHSASPPERRFQIVPSRSHSPKRSPIISVGTLMFAQGTVGMMLASAT